MTVPDPATTKNPLGAKPKKWAHGGEVPSVTLTDGSIAEAMAAIGYAWDATSSTFVQLAVDHGTGALKVFVSGGGAGGGAVTIADGADVAEGATADGAYSGFGNGSVISLLKGLYAKLAGQLTINGLVEIQAGGGFGFTPYFADAITTTVTVSSGVTCFGGCALINLNSSPAYLQCFDTAEAVTLGATVPTFVIPFPANSTAANGAADRFAPNVGINITSGTLKVAATTTAKGASTVSAGLSGTIMLA